MPYTKKNTVVSSMTLGSNFDASDTAINVFCSAQLQARIVNDQVPTDLGRVDPKSVSCDLLAAPYATMSFTAAGKTVNGVQFAALARQVGLDVATFQNITL